MKKIQILLVEDDNIIAMEIQTRLEDKGYIVIGPFAYGEDVIKKIDNFDFDLVLMDINLKGNLDGIQTAQIIKEKYRKPIIYLTAFTDNNTIERAKITEPFGYIVKPFEERELFTNIEMALYKHKIESQLIESEQWLKTTLKSIGDGVIATDIYSNIKFMNEVAEDLTGWCLDDAIGKKLNDVFVIISETTRQPAINPIDRVINEGIVVGLANHTLLINKNGDEIPIADTASPIKDNEGKITGCVLVFQDHTEKRNYQLSLEESEAKYKATLESLDDGIFVVDKDLNIVLMNQTFKTWVSDLGLSHTHNGNSKNLENYSPFVNERIIDDIKRTFETQIPYKMDEDYSVNGKILFTETKRFPIHSKNDDARLVTIIKDITENRLNQDELRKSKSQLQSILDFTPSIVYIKDLSGCFQLVNKKFEQIFKTPNESITGKNENELFDSFTAEILSRNDYKVIEENKIETYEEYILVDDEFFHTYLFSKFLLFDSYNNPTSICTVATDITERKKAEEEIFNLNMFLEQRVMERTEQVNIAMQNLKDENEKRKKIQLELINKQKELSTSLGKEKELNIMKNDFISMVSHEYRTPLTVIQTSKTIIEMIINKGIPEDIGLHLDRIEKSVSRMTDLLEETIDLNRLYSKNTLINPVDFDLIPFLNSIIEVCQVSEKKTHVYELSTTLNQCMVHQDQSSINHIFSNLICNAAKYSDVNSMISIDLKEIEGNQLLIHVKDQGIGIPEKELEHIFESFFRGSNVRTISGTGLGLAIVKKNVELINGEISIESLVGTGTTLKLILPKIFPKNNENQK